MNFTPASASPLTEKKMDGEKPRLVYVVAYHNTVDEHEVLLDVDGAVFTKCRGTLGAVAKGGYYESRREALTVALKAAQRKVVDANAEVNRLIGELHQS